ncbi:MAG TPA: CBS domain-containing protein [Candidatus Dormibacteraeota bacterium]|nr:CBS domain-containing protein [Candidatus Dormibacteraeota bacterium]
MATPRALTRDRSTVSDVMTVHVHVASASTPIKLLVRLIEENRVGAIPIVDQQGVPIGIVLETDLLMVDRWHGRNGAEGVAASQIMTSAPIAIGSDTSLTEAARLMRERKVRHLVVVDERGGIAGIVSRGDLL